MQDCPNDDFCLDKVENIVGKGENAGYQHFLHFPLCFQKASFLGSLQVGINSLPQNPENIAFPSSH